jgi:DNA-directed RNA polymerase specialized sigma24 family protein
MDDPAVKARYESCINLGFSLMNKRTNGVRMDTPYAQKCKLAGLDRDDLTQLVMIAVWRAAVRFDPGRLSLAGKPIMFSTYAGTAVTNALNGVFDAIKHRRSVIATASLSRWDDSELDGHDCWQGDVEDESPPPEASVDAADELEAMRRTVGHTSREVIDAILASGGSHKLAGKLLGITKQAVRCRMRRLRRLVGAEV